MPAHIYEAAAPDRHAQRLPRKDVRVETSAAREEMMFR